MTHSKGEVSLFTKWRGLFPYFLPMNEGAIMFLRTQKTEDKPATWEDFDCVENSHDISRNFFFFSWTKSEIQRVGRRNNLVRGRIRDKNDHYIIFPGLTWVIQGFCESLSSINAPSGNSLSLNPKSSRRIASNGAINKYSLLKEHNHTAHIFSLLRVFELSIQPA